MVYKKKNQICFCICKKKKVFGEEKSDPSLLNKTKPFGLKISDLFFD